MLVAFGSEDDDLDVFALGDALRRRGWYLDRQGPPQSLHATVNAVHATVMSEFIATLHEAVAEVRDIQATGDAGAYGTVE